MKEDRTMIYPNIKKIDKNFIRVQLLDLIDSTDSKPILVTGKFKHTNDAVWYTFTTIRPYLENCKTYTICDHINIKRTDVDNWRRMYATEHNRKFYLVGVPFIYSHYGIERGGFKLSENLGCSPVVMTDDFHKLKKQMLSKVFSLNGFGFEKVKDT